MKKNKLLQKKDDKIDRLGVKIDKLLNKNSKMDKRIKKLLDKADNLQDQNDDIIEKIETICDDRVIKPGKLSDTHVFVIIKNNDDDEEYQYHTIRRLRNTIKPAIASYKDLHPDASIIVYIEYNPNPINLWNRIKDNLGKGRQRKILFDGNNFKLRDDYTQEEMIHDINAIHNQRFEYED